MSWRARVRRFALRFARSSGCSESCEMCLTTYLAASTHPNDYGRAVRRTGPMLRRVERAMRRRGQSVFPVGWLDVLRRKGDL